MARPVSEAERLRQCRLVFERAVHERVSMDQARTALALERIRDRQRRIDALRRRVAAVASEPEFLDRIAASRRADRAATEAYARTCALLGEHDEGDDA
jgi:hypothetical protein